MSKISELAEIEGYDSLDEALEVWAYDSVVPGICTNPGCGYTDSMEPDGRGGRCDICGTNTVSSPLVILGVI